MSNLIAEIKDCKNKFVQFLELNNAENISEFYGEKEDDDGWDYYCMVDGFVKDQFHYACFMIWNGVLTIDFSNDKDSYGKLNILEFSKLIQPN